MFLRPTTLAFSAALCAGVMATSAHAEDSFTLSELTCFDVISQSAEDSLFLIALLIGNAIDDPKSTEMTGIMLEATIENFDATCGENPDMMAIDALKLG